MHYWWRHTKVRFQGPWKLSKHHLVLSAETKEEADKKMIDVAFGFQDEIHALSEDPNVPQGPYDTEQEARDAADINFRLMQAKKQTLSV